MALYTLRNVSFQYPDADRNALDDISLTVESGEFITVCGLSGCGKTTLLRLLKPCISPHGKTNGTIMYNDQPLASVPLVVQVSDIGYVTQSPDNRSITDKVWHELAFGLESLGLSNAVIRRRTAETAAFFGIEDLFDQDVAALSGGQKQLVSLASVVVMQPSVILLDEPCAQLDPVASEELLNMLRKINTELGITVIMSEHQLDEVFSISDRVLVMENGSVIADTRPSEAANMLYSTKSPVFESLPLPSRVFAYAGGQGASPVSVAQGREWLREYISGRLLRPLSTRQQLHCAGKPCMELKNIWFRYDKKLPDVLCGVDLPVYSGQILAVLGGNGAGKSTLLSVMSGGVKPYRGSIRLNGKTAAVNRPYEQGIAMLPQNPQALFVKSTVESDLYEIFLGMKLDAAEQKERVEEVVDLCGLKDLCFRHPFDLSGGEQQRAALAKVLLTKPKFLLLDEPTKGLDAAFRKRLAAILARLKSEGLTIILVSHDLTFCAENADRCVMLFRGAVISDSEPHSFFTQNSIYTTAVNRMTRGIINGTATEAELLQTLDIRPQIILPDHAEKSGQKKETPHDDDTAFPPDGDSQQSVSPNNNIFSAKTPNGHPKKIIRAAALLLLSAVFLLSVMITTRTLTADWLPESPMTAYLTMFLSSISIILLWGGKQQEIPIVRSQKSRIRSAVSVVLILIIVPITIFAGVVLFDDTKYLFISLLIMLESVIPFFMMFERRGIQARELVLIAALCAMCTAGRAVLYMLPELKPVTALVTVSAVALGSETGFLIGSVSMLASNIFFGQGVWTPWQMFAMGLVGFLGGTLFHIGMIPRTKATISAFGFCAALFYGGIMNPASLILSRSPITAEGLLSCYALGLPLDMVHAVSTAVFLYIGAEPILSKLERIKRKYGIGVADPCD